MKKLLGFLHRLEWSNPYTNPPDGVRVVKEIFIPIDDESCRQMPREIEEMLVIGSGYCHTIRAITPFPRERSREALASLRQKRLRRRVEEKYPLYADQFIEEELRKKADYYDGLKDERLVRARKEIREEERELRERLGR